MANSYFQTNHLVGKTRQPFPTKLISMDDNVVTAKKKKKAAPPITTTTTNNKRPRRVTRTKPKCKEEEEEVEEEATTGVDIEDLGFCRNETLEIRASLLEWYDLNQRDLPWRRISSSDEDHDKDASETRAYAVWVSEIMLQQTRVQTVVDYFNRWMLKWPTLAHLARASLEGAKMIVEEGGVFPKTVSALRKVPGIGDYTAGAIASIAFKEVVPVVDGNVVRVVARLKAISANPKEKLAGQLVDPSRSGDFNQALMELGATVCTPLNPSCSVCPVSAHCRALSRSKQHTLALVTDYPIRVVKSKQRHDFTAVSVVEILESQDMIEELQSDGRFLLVKRPDEGLLAGLWEFPSVLLGVETDLATRRNAIDKEDIGEYVHIFSHIRLKMYVELLVLCLKGGTHVLHEKPDSKTMAWKSVNSEALSSMGLTSGVRKHGLTLAREPRLGVWNINS
ncbi:hypothetical protein HYC85_031559 [Camellia sinensis]|uniref:Adenine DNA glycosylase n=1 Tax=Camellia sinensis TaxID=4442 RepID=A0A7J7FUI0_CAMSI|nr:hypothetical protein HYC85_031559 [Camellia sinensis]